jgi:hypothetical protein
VALDAAPVYVCGPNITEIRSMSFLLRSLKLGAAGLAMSLVLVGPGAFAEDAPEVPMKQIKLTDKQVTDFISAQPELAAISSKLQATNGQPDAAAQADLEAIAKKHGFADFSELDDVAANISLIMAGLDAQTGEFTDPAEALTKELDGVKADNSIGEADKKQLVDQLTDAIESTPKVEHKENVDIVKAHRAEIEKALQ